MIPVADVLYFQAEDKYTKVVTREAEAHHLASCALLLVVLIVIHKQFVAVGLAGIVAIDRFWV